MIEITHDELNAADVEARVRHPGAGAIVVFVGTTRDNTAGRKVLALEYEAYRPMADQQLEQVAAEMCERWDLICVAISHRPRQA